MKAKRTGYYNGNSGEVWIAGVKIGTCNKGKVTTKIKYEEVDNPDVPGGKIRVKVGETHEVSLTYKSTGKEEDLDIFDPDKDVTVIMNDATINGVNKNRIKCDGVTFDERVRVDFEKGKVKEISLQGQSERVTEIK